MLSFFGFLLGVFQFLVRGSVFVACVTVVLVFSPSMAFASPADTVSHWTGLTMEDALNLTLFIGAVMPLIGNLAAVICTRIGWLHAAAVIARWTPFATKVASKALEAPTQAQAVRAVVVLASEEPGLGPISQAAELLKSIPPPVDDKPILEAVEVPKAPTVPLAVLLVFLVGCGGAMPQVDELVDDSADYMAAGATVANAAAPCFDERKELKLAHVCKGDAACELDAREEAAETDSALATMRRIFCKYAPAGVCS